MTAPYLNHHLSHRPLKQLAQETVQHLRSAFSQAGPVTLVGHRVGWRPMPAAGPIVGYLTPDRRAYVAVMHSGVTLAATVGRLVADESTSGRVPDALRRTRPPLYTPTWGAASSAPLY
jgi:glycine/D-amino acid oxidase-like deaminating enzyme